MNRTPILERIAFVGLLGFLTFVGAASLIGYPGPLVLWAFSLGGLVGWALARHHQWIGALVIAALTVAAIMSLLISYSNDGVTALVLQFCVLGLMAYALAWVGIEASRAVWRPSEQRT